MNCKIAVTITLINKVERTVILPLVDYGMLQAPNFGTNGNKKTANINVKTKFIKTVIGDVVAHLKPQKFTISSYL